MNIAIVGTGIAGLTAAALLHRRHRITVFEASGRCGGHAHTVEVREGRHTLPIDTGFIVYNEVNYPRLCALFDALGVESVDSDMSFSVQCEASGLEYNGSSINALFAQRRNALNLGHWRMLRDILRFHRSAPGARAQLSDDVTVGDFVAAHRFGRDFSDRYLLPLGASLWSCSARRFASFPMRLVLEFLENHRMLQAQGRPQWKTVRGGSRRYVDRLVRPFSDRIRLETPVAAVRRTRRGPVVQTADGAETRFDEVVLATHADQSLRLIAQPDDLEREVLSHFPYQPNEVVLHTDIGQLPRRRRAWASWNYRIPSHRRASVSVTYNMNRLQGLETATTYCVTLNPGPALDPTRIIARNRFDHPTFMPGYAGAQAAHLQLIRREGISYCGAYWGFGFHEDGVQSGLRVAEAFGRSLEQIAA